MSDGFRPEVLAAFMQQVVDAPKIPNLFMRTVSLQTLLSKEELQSHTDRSTTGYPSRHDVQVAAAVRVDDPFVAPHRQEDLGGRPSLGRLHPPGESDRTEFVRCTPAIAAGAAS
jgi:hypothetical protein